MKRRAFTLIELLVVIAIIGLLSTVAVITMGSARDKARIAAGQSLEQSIHSKLADQLEGEWLFNSTVGSTTPDTSGFTRTGTLTGTTLVTGINGNALSFDGASWVALPAISIAPDITVTAWIYPTSANQNGFIVGKLPVNTEWQIFLEGNLMRWRGGSSVSIACPTPTINTWHYVVGTQSGTQSSLYIDGVRCATGTVTALPNGGGQVQIGTFQGNYNFRGLIDQVRIYSGSIL